MKIRLRPSTTLDPGLARDLGFPAGSTIALPWIDEDEATLAIEAARRLLRTLPPTQPPIERLECVGPAASTWAAVVQAALPVPNAEVVAATGPLPDRPAAGTLRVSAHAPRATTPAFESTRETAAATAQIGDDATLDGVAIGPPRVLDRPLYERLARAESKALRQVPMGAYVSLQAWNASAPARYQLLASRCLHCHRGQHPPLPVCPVCGNPTQVAPLAETGALYTHTTIAAGGGPSEFDALQEIEGTYTVAVVEFGDGIRVAGMMTHAAASDLTLGRPLGHVVRRLYAQEDVWRHGTKFHVAPTR